MKIFKIPAFVLSICCMLAACNTKVTEQTSETISDTVRIVSLNGTVTEILAGLGLDKNIAGVDVTSTFPESMQSKPKVGHNRNIAAEGVLALQPDIIIGLKQDVKPELAEQFKNAGVKLVLFEQEYTPEGARKLIRKVTDSLKAPSQKADSLINLLDTDLAKVTKSAGAKPKVLFIYARGTGTMMVAGEDTNVEDIIELAGGENAVKGFKDFKPLTAEALVEADPDILLLFDSGLESLGGAEGLLKVQGIMQTKAGKNKKIIGMDGQLLTGFGPRLGQAASELAQKMKN